MMRIQDEHIQSHQSLIIQGKANFSSIALQLLIRF